MKFFRLAFLGSLSCLSIQAQDRVMVFGDSQSEEYAFEFPFSVPFAGDFTDHADNWIEILDQRRDDYLDFGDYEETIFAYGDYRNAGHEFNWSVPGARTETLREIITGDGLQFLTSALRISDQLRNDDITWVVIFLGGNDLDRVYTDLYENAPEPDFPGAIISNLETIIDTVIDDHPAARIILVNVPDVGVTPVQIEDHPIAAQRATASVFVRMLNDEVADLAEDKQAELADVASMTERIGSPEPLFWGWLPLIKAGSPLNPADHIFCRDGFHPNSSAQAMIANEILKAMNRWPDTNIPLLGSREVIEQVLQLDPDQPYIDWLRSEGLPEDSTYDVDGNANGVMDLFDFFVESGGLAPLEDSAGVLSWDLDLNPAATRYGRLVLERSGDLSDDSWTPVAEVGFGETEFQYATPMNQGPIFYRFRIRENP